MDRINNFLEDDTRRVLEISSQIWIKRVYTEDGILFECEKVEKNRGTILNTYNKKSDVLEWYRSL